MKKVIAIMALSLSSTAFASGYVSLDVDKVNGLKGSKDSIAQYVRAGKSFGDTQIGLQSRTARFENGGLANSLELALSNNKVTVAGIKPFVGVGYDNGLNGANKGSFQYGLLGATAGAKVGPGFALVGAKTRVGSTEDGPNTKQTLAFTTYSIPVAKNLAVNLNASRSYQTIKETAYGLGLSVSF